MQTLLKLTHFVSKTFALWAIFFWITRIYLSTNICYFRPLYSLFIGPSHVWHGNYLNFPRFRRGFQTP